jgi:class 3 adenylate cyclase
VRGVYETCDSFHRHHSMRPESAQLAEPNGSCYTTPQEGGRLVAQIVTLLFTDLAGSSALLDQLGDVAADEARRTHFSLLREAVADSGGEEVKNLGDGLMVVFPSAVAAVRCAIGMQQAIHQHNTRAATTTLGFVLGSTSASPSRMRTTTSAHQSLLPSACVIRHRRVRSSFPASFEEWLPREPGLRSGLSAT